MIVYLDIFILHNFLINIIILYLSSHLCKLKVNHSLAILVVLLYTLLSMVLLLYSNCYVLNAYKLILPVIISAINFPHASLKTRLKFLVNFIILTIVLSGVMLAIAYITPYSAIGTSTVTTICSVIVLISTSKIIISYFSSTLKNHQNYSTITIVHNGISLNLNGFNDTGNSLVSDITKLPIFICDPPSLEPILKNCEIQFHCYNCHTILQNGSIKTFMPDCIYVDNQKCSALIGLSQTTLNSDYDAIINLQNIKYDDMEINYV